MGNSSYPLAWNWIPEKIRSLGPLTIGTRRRKLGGAWDWHFEIRWKDQPVLSANSHTDGSWVMWRHARVHRF